MEDLTKLSKQELIDRLNSQQSDDMSAQFQEIDRIAAQASPMAVEVRETRDHKPVYLYRELGDRMGPFHPDNAKDIMRRWKMKGFNLYTKPRTPAQIEAYKQTPLYAKRKLEEDTRNKKYAEQSQRNKPEHWAKLVAKETAIAVSEAASANKAK